MPVDDGFLLSYDRALSRTLLVSDRRSRVSWQLAVVIKGTGSRPRFGIWKLESGSPSDSLVKRVLDIPD